MKKALLILLVLLITCALTCCNQASPQPDSTDENTTPPQANLPYSFISAQERASWKDHIINTLTSADRYEELAYGCFGAALMDLNLDSRPELLLAYTGGSMGNVCLIAFDIESGQEVCHLGETPHYDDCYSVYLCMHRSDNGDYLLINKGALRNGLKWYDMTSKLTDDYKFDVIFEEVSNSLHISSRYYCEQKEVDSIEFEVQKALFAQLYTEIPETQIQIIYWDDLNAADKDSAIARMADALIGSEQQFIDYNS